MRKILDIARFILVSPELLVGLILLFIHTRYEEPGAFVYSIFQSEQVWPIAAVLGVPVGLIVACYKLGTNILSPHGKRSSILEWPEYWRLKFRVVYSLILCMLAFVISLLGYYFVHQQRSLNGAYAIVIAWSVATTSLASLALSKWKAREILGE
jgi:magnesium-transporting ATPase (P-type)